MPGAGFHHAVVMGGSMAGLLAARALSDHFEKVTLIERDKLPHRPEARKGVPQGRHVHILLAHGRAVLESLFPGLTDELGSAGAVHMNAGRDIAWHHAGGWRKRHHSDLPLMAMTRPLLEAQVVARVRALPNVGIIEGARVDVPVFSGNAVTGVRYAQGKQRKELDAEMVVDATGRGSAMPRWLQEHGCGTVTTKTITVPLAYSTCLFPRSGQDIDWKGLLLTDPAAKRGSFCLATEGDRWVVTLAAMFDQPLPNNLDAFLSLAASMPISALYEMLRDRKPLTGVMRYRFPGSQRRHYRRMRTLPAGLIAVGDAVCSFNPVYGQGMTVAACEALALSQQLSEASHNGSLDRRFSRRWYRAVDRIVDLAWQGVSIEDFQFPEVAEPRPPHLRPVQWYMNRVHRATHRDRTVTNQFYRVVNFVDRPTALLRPGIMARVLFSGRAGAGS